MQISGGTELGYASTAILTELLKHLIEIDVITPQATAEILEKATGALESLRRTRLRTIALSLCLPEASCAPLVMETRQIGPPGRIAERPMAQAGAMRTRRVKRRLTGGAFSSGGFSSKDVRAPAAVAHALEVQLDSREPGGWLWR
jgi:hypothetical protein